MEAGAVFLPCWDGTIGDVLPDKRLPLGARFIASISSEGHRKTDGATDIMTGDGIVREGIRGIAMVIMAINIREQTAHMLTQGIIEDEHRVSLRPADCLRLLEQIRDPTLIDLVVEPGRFREKAGEIGFVRTLEYTAGHISQAFVIQDDQACYIVLKVLKLASILAEIPKDGRVSDNQGSGSHDGKLHET